MRLKKKRKSNQTRTESLGGGGEGGVNLRPRDREIYEPVTQHYSVTTSRTVINTANEHSGAVQQHGPRAHKTTVGEFH